MKIKFKKTFIFYFILFLFISFLASCKKTESKDYRIKGEIKNYNGTVYLIKAIDAIYYFNNFIKDSTIAVDGKFEFRLSKKNNIPLPFYIETAQTRTGQFILEPKNQQLLIDSLYFNVKPIIISENSTIQNEEVILGEKLKPFLNEFKIEFKKIRGNDLPKDSIEKFSIALRKSLTKHNYKTLIDFTKEFPNSYVAFWKILISQMYNGYNEELEKAYNNLSNTIKQTKEAKIFKKRMLEAKMLQEGNLFPEIKLSNIDSKELIFKVFENSDSKYILIDFWFSYCGPCIAQFPKLKELQKKYSPNQLSIISISTDKTKNVNNWFKVVDRKKITWLNLLDENGTETSVLGINKFPTNYLLNKEGIILEKDISLTDLEKVLKED
ncbi:TlpA disulfide reductase family protein [Lutibacter sp.]|uniref:TlpA disulfide reductase family protein n=1 Tax=Lutibacter sp. TaxID=1925666 RepID=UPI0025C1165C|nr:TlpA disulfide reductase family protein [Lutibacter sp.]MCF6181073.1 AhpC/TSA family protein [Lutibacter sp.]